MASRRPCPDSIRPVVLTKQRYRCLYCRLPIGTVLRRGGRTITTDLEWDHRIPYAYLQANPARNWAASCNVCNRLKSSNIFVYLHELRHWMKQQWAARNIEWLWIPPVSSEADPHRWAVSFATYLASLPRREAEVIRFGPAVAELVRSSKHIVFDEEPVEHRSELEIWLEEAEPNG